MVDELADGDCGRTTSTETQEEKEEVGFANGLRHIAARNAWLVSAPELQSPLLKIFQHLQCGLPDRFIGANLRRICQGCASLCSIA